ncbi:unnamed protein product [Pleuronectes platessa]|uniref:Uncharacterized protein n=1 Tax=Pleuronectes platessa TaxID=8262 RepID=A0A9N7YDC2_PLEPL|nr:unnamed protein product [Pleuronectes platessa]
MLGAGGDAGLIRLVRLGLEELHGYQTGQTGAGGASWFRLVRLGPEELHGYQTGQTGAGGASWFRLVRLGLEELHGSDWSDWGWRSFMVQTGHTGDLGHSTSSH